LALAYPVLVLHLVLLPLNAMRLRQMIVLVRQVRMASQDDLSLDWIKPFSTVREVRSGETVFCKGDTANEMFFVISERFRLAEICIDILQGQVVGELGFLNPHKARTATLEFVDPENIAKLETELATRLPAAPLN
jgi:hypothetical protein